MAWRAAGERIMPTVDDIMTPNPCTVEPDDTLGEVIRLMKERGCRQLPVVKEGEIVGIVTDRDVRLAMNSPFVAHDGEDNITLMRHIPAEACMTPDPVTIDADAPVEVAADLLCAYKFGGLPVVRGGDLVGIITVTDILAYTIRLIRQMEDAPA
jgi:acetoin utilization protein AcuB